MSTRARTSADSVQEIVTRCRFLVPGVLFACIACQPSVSELELIEIFSYQLPASLSVDGVRVGADDVVLTWSETQHQLVVVDSTSLTIISHPQLKHPVAADFLSPSGALVASEPVIEVLISSGSVVRFDLNGRLIQTRHVDGLSDVADAVRVEEGWVAIMHDPVRGSSFLVYVSDESHAAMVFDHVSLPREQSPGHSLRLTGWGDRVIVSSTRFPFFAAVVSLAEERVEFEIRRDDMFAADYDAWVALPILPVRIELLQMFADPGSDHRVFVVYDADGWFSRLSTIEAPFALVAHRMDPPRLLGIRRAGHSEVVGYEWKHNYITDLRANR